MLSLDTFDEVDVGWMKGPDEGVATLTFWGALKKVVLNYSSSVLQCYGATGLPGCPVGDRKKHCNFSTQTVWPPPKTEVSKRGWREGVGDKQTPKRAQKVLQKCVPLLLGRA